MNNKDMSRSWFIVLNNPQEIYEGEPEEIAEKVLADWVEAKPTRTGAVAYCISAAGLIHLHMVLEDTCNIRFSALKKAFPKAHLEPTKGTKEQAEDYINKRGKFEEKGEQVLYIARYGEIKGCQGARKDFEIIQDLIEQGKTPNEILSMAFSYRRYDKMIRDAYYQKRYAETPIKREVKVYWHVGESGSGKSYTVTGLVEKYGESNVYIVSDYDHGFDKYNGEKVIFMDEFRGQIKYSQLLLLLDGYKVQIPCRYSNAFALWDEVHITSVLPPESCYYKMVIENASLDVIDQLFRRIDCVVYHFKDDGFYCAVDIPMEKYTNYRAIQTKHENGEDIGLIYWA